MSSFNEQLKRISSNEVLIVIILLYTLGFGLKFFDIIKIDVGVINSIIILFFVFKLRDYFFEFKSDFFSVFSVVSFKEMIMIVLMNIFFSYGMLYLSGYILHGVPADYFSFLIATKSICVEFAGIFSLISIVLISPIAEELIFRGVFLNKLRFIVPTIFAVLVSALLFASLHGFGSIISAFVFGICMALLYLKTDNILVPILAHFLNNLIGETIYHLDYQQLLFKNDFIMALMSILAIASFILILKFISSNLKNI